MPPTQRMVRCIVGLGGPRSADYPFRRVHIGRAFVEHVAVAHDYPVWRPLSSALADVCELDGVVLCRLWHQCVLVCWWQFRQFVCPLGIREMFSLFWWRSLPHLSSMGLFQDAAFHVVAILSTLKRAVAKCCFGSCSRHPTSFWSWMAFPC